MIRKATEADAKAVERIVAAAYAPLAQKMDKPPAPMLDDYPARISQGVVDVWVDGDSVFGMIILVDQSDALMLENVAVAPEAQFPVAVEIGRDDRGIVGPIFKEGFIVFQ